MGRLAFLQVVLVVSFGIDVLAPIATGARKHQDQSRSSRFHQQLSAFRDCPSDGLFLAGRTRCGSHPHVVRGFRSRAGG